MEAIVEANQRAFAGDPSAGFRRSDFADHLPIIALTCIDPRLNPLLPQILGLTEEDFIWLRNAGNVITSSLSSTMRSLALACALKGGKEVAIFGHTDCRVKQTTVMELTDRFRALGIERSRLPDNLTEYFGLFASERQNVLKAVDFVRRSPLIGAKIPVHGLLLDTLSGRLEWLENGYEVLATANTAPLLPAQPTTVPLPPVEVKTLGPPQPIQFPKEKIGEFTLDQQKRPAPLHTVPTPDPAPFKAKPPPVIPPISRQTPSPPQPVRKPAIQPVGKPALRE